MASLTDSLVSLIKQKKSQQNQDQRFDLSSRRFQEQQRQNALDRGFREQQLRNANQAQLLAQEKSKEIPGDLAGRVTLAQEALANIPKVKQILFPTGQPESFERMIAGGANLPRITIPFTGIGTPEVMPFAKRPQEVNRLLGSALAGRRLIQTGVASNPDERREMVRQFGVGFTSNAEALKGGLDQLEAFNRNFLKNVDPTGRRGLRPNEGGQLVEDANGNKAIMYPDGTFEEVGAQ